MFKRSRLVRKTELVKPRPRYDTTCTCGKVVRLKTDRFDHDKLYLSCPHCKRTAELVIKRDQPDTAVPVPRTMAITDEESIVSQSPPTKEE